MSRAHLRIASLGGVPPMLGGGGLEIQRDRTMDALRALGCSVVDVHTTHETGPFDVLHVFGSEPDIWHTLRHWRRNPAPLVISPVLVVEPGRSERRMALASRVGRPMTPPRMRRDLLRKADLLVALTDHEAALLRSLAPDTHIEVIGNGVDEIVPVEPDLAALGISQPYVVLLGTVSRRKQQIETLAALSGSQWQPVVIGGLDGGAEDGVALDQTLARSRGVWLGDVSDQGLVRGLLAGADALLHFSRAEGQSLAILESLSVHTPVVCSDLPANRELARRFPGWVVITPPSSGLDAVIARAGSHPPDPPRVDTWTQVAQRLVGQYRRLVPSTK